MFINKRGSTETYEEERSNVRKVNRVLIIAIILIFVLTLILAANNTSMIERKLFNLISDGAKYELSYSNIYEDLAVDNNRQGNYIQLSDEEMGIYVLFRYDEDINLENLNRQGMYTVKKQIEDMKKLQNSDIMLMNIDRTFNRIYNNNVGGDYKVTKIGTDSNNKRIVLKSNLLSSVGVGNLGRQRKIKKASEVTKWFSYTGSKAYMLRKLKDIVENSGLKGRGDNFKYSDEVDTDKDKFSTHTEIIVAEKGDFKLFGNTGNTHKTTKGVLLGVCPNNEVAIEKLDKTVTLLSFILYLEGTVFL